MTEPDKIAAAFTFVCIWIWNFLQDRKADRLQSRIDLLEQRLKNLAMSDDKLGTCRCVCHKVGLLGFYCCPCSAAEIAEYMAKLQKSPLPAQPAAPTTRDIDYSPKYDAPVLNDKAPEMPNQSEPFVSGMGQDEACPDCGSKRKPFRLCVNCKTSHSIDLFSNRGCAIRRCTGSWHIERPAPNVTTAPPAPSQVLTREQAISVGITVPDDVVEVHLYGHSYDIDKLVTTAPEEAAAPKETLCNQAHSDRKLSGEDARVAAPITESLSGQKERKQASIDAEPETQSAEIEAQVSEHAVGKEAHDAALKRFPYEHSTNVREAFRLGYLACSSAREAQIKKLKEVISFWKDAAQQGVKQLADRDSKITQLTKELDQRWDAYNNEVKYRRERELEIAELTKKLEEIAKLCKSEQT